MPRVLEVGGIDFGDAAKKAIVAVGLIMTAERLLATHSIQCVRDATRLDTLPTETHPKRQGKEVIEPTSQ